MSMLPFKFPSHGYVKVITHDINVILYYTQANAMQLKMAVWEEI